MKKENNRRYNFVRQAIILHSDVYKELELIVPNKNDVLYTNDHDRPVYILPLAN